MTSPPDRSRRGEPDPADPAWVDHILDNLTSRPLPAAPEPEPPAEEPPPPVSAPAPREQRLPPPRPVEEATAPPGTAPPREPPAPDLLDDLLGSDVQWAEAREDVAPAPVAPRPAAPRSPGPPPAAGREAPPAGAPPPAVPAPAHRMRSGDPLLGVAPPRSAAPATPAAPAPPRRRRMPVPADTMEEPFTEEYEAAYDEEFDEPLEEFRSPLRTALGWGLTIALAVVLSLVIRSFVAHAFHVESGSMLPTLEPDDRILVNKLSDNPSRGDLVVFQRSSGDLVKRVVALAGEIVYFDEGLIKIGDRWLDEPYLTAGTGTWAPGAAIPNCEVPEGFSADSACIVPPDHVFVLGDNRQVSFDSRNFGPVPRSDIIGTAAFQFWPLGDLRSL